MRGSMSGAFSTPRLGIMALCLILSTASASAAEDASAHALAERFAGPSDDARKAEEMRKRTAEAERVKAVKAAAEAKRKAEDAKRRAELGRTTAEQRKADETEMLERARAEAAEREAEKKRALAEIERQEQERLAAEAAEAERRQAEARKAAQAKAESERRAAEEQKAARARAEAEKAAQAKAEADRLEREARLAEEKRRADEERAAAARAEVERRIAEAEAAERTRAAEAQAAREASEAAAAQRLAEERRVADERRLAEERQAIEERRRAAEQQAEAERRAEAERVAAREAEQEKIVLEAEREAEALRLTEKIRKAREAREARREPGIEPVTGPSNPPPLSAVQSVRSEPAGHEAVPQIGTRVAVLLMMTAGSKGIRRWNKSADPMLCIDDVCYISAGAEAAAKRLPRSTAFGPGVALGSRAGACNNSLGCVFRDIDLAAQSAQLQPIDLRVVRHDRREQSEVRPDETCAVSGGKLECRAGVSSSTWRAWIVPEAVAARAGSAVLEAAVSAGLSAGEASLRGDR